MLILSRVVHASAFIYYAALVCDCRKQIVEDIGTATQKITEEVGTLYCSLASFLAPPRFQCFTQGGSG